MLQRKNTRHRSLIIAVALLLVSLLFTGCVWSDATPTQAVAQTDATLAPETPTVNILCPSVGVCHLADGTLKWRITCTYDAMGNLKQVNHYSEEATVKYAYVFTYNSQGKILSRDSGDDLDFIHYTYSSAGNRLRMFQGVSRWDYEYNVIGSLMVENEYTSDILYRKTTYSYNKKGLKESAHIYDSNGDLVSYYLYAYEEEDKLCREQFYPYYGALPTVTESRYDERGSLIEQTFYDPTGKVESRIRHTYDSYGNRLSSTQYNASGAVVWWVEYTYEAKRVPEANLTFIYEARKEILGF